MQFKYLKKISKKFSIISLFNKLTRRRKLKFIFNNIVFKNFDITYQQ